MLLTFAACTKTDTDTTADTDGQTVSADETTSPVEDTTKAETTSMETTSSTTTAAPDTTVEDTADITTEEDATSADTTTETTTTVPDTTKAPDTTTAAPVVRTAQPSVISQAATAADRMVIYGRAEYGSIIKNRTNTDTKVYYDESDGKTFFIEVSGSHGSTITLYLTAQTEGKTESAEVSVSVTFSGEGVSEVWIGRNSRMFYMPTLNYMFGNVIADQDSLDRAVGKTKKLLENVRAATGKNTKLIYAIIPNPSNVYYDEQRDYLQAAVSTTERPKSVMTQFTDAMKNNNDIYVLDLFPSLYAHKDEMIYFRTDTHYTELGAYYCYLDIMNAVQKDYPGAKVRKIGADYTVDYVENSAGDIAGMIGLGAMETFPTFIAKFSDTGSYYKSKRADGIKTCGYNPGAWQQNSSISSSNPTCYFLGDSYGCFILPFIGANFSQVWTNSGILWNYNIDYAMLAQNKPDYLIFVLCERNINTSYDGLLNP